MLTNEGDIAECMNEYSASVFTAENYYLIKLSKTRILVFYTVHLRMLARSELKPRKSPGPDGIHPMILKKCAGSLAPSLRDVFNASLASGMLPHNW